jgi:ABC-type transport system substrate-binding protein
VGHREQDGRDRALRRLLGEKAKTKTIIFKTISDLNARKQALRNNEIQGYDLVAPADVEALKSEGFNVLTRPAFNVLYLAFNQSGPAKAALSNVKVRQALAYAINRDAIVKSKYPDGSTVAMEFQPPGLDGYNDAVTKYEYNPDKAKQMLAEAGRDEPDAEVLVPDRGHPAVHAGAEGHPRTDRRRPAEGGHHGHAGGGQVEPRTTSTAFRPAPTTTCTCWAGRVTTPTRTTSSARSSTTRRRSGASTTRPCSRTSPRPTPSRMPRSAPSCTRT